MTDQTPNPGPDPAPRPTAAWRPDRLRLGELMLLIAGFGVGLAVVMPHRAAGVGAPPEFLLVAAAVLGGVSLIGPPLLLSERRRRRVPWGAGRFLWFSSGTSAWLLWPPALYRRAHGADFSDTVTGACFAYGTPLMAVYVTLALLAGGAFRRGRRRRIRRSWRETFGLLVGLAWACTGGYLILLFAYEDITK